MILRLLWKESREHFWKLLVLTAALIVPVLLSRLFWPGELGLVSSPLVFASWIIPVWIASFTAASERNVRSLELLLSLPVRRHWIFLCKTVAGLLTVLLPLTLMIVAGLLLLPGFSGEIGDHYLVAVTLTTAATLYTLFLAITIGAGRESRAAMICVLLLIGCILWDLLAFTPSEFYFSRLELINPLSLFFVSQTRYMSTDLLVYQLLFALLWWIVAAVRFLSAPSYEEDVPHGDARSSRLAVLLPLPFPPLAWKEVREQGWVVLCAFLAALGTAGIAGVIASREGNPDLWTLAEATVEVIVVAGSIMPIVAAVVLGVGAFGNDLEQHLLNFWYAQPIPLRDWFWTKYGVSIFGILLLLLVPICMGVGGSLILDIGGKGTAVRDSAWNAFIFSIIFLPFAHAVSILLAALIRQTMYAAILSIIIVLCVTFCPMGGTRLVDALVNVAENPGAVLLSLAISLAVTAACVISARAIIQRQYRFG